MPILFPHTLGQSQAKMQIEQAMLHSRLPHAYLVHGPDGSGQFALALDAALLFFCAGEKKPCLECRECKKVLSGHHADFHVYHPFPSADALKMKDEAYAEYRREQVLTLIKNPYVRLLFEKEARYSIDAMREMQENLLAGKTEGRLRIAVLCEVDRMGEEAANRILKTLEEPPPGVIFFLLTARPSRLLPTVVSRCSMLRLGELSASDVMRLLEQTHASASREMLERAARLSQGNLARAQEWAQGELDAALAMAERWMAVSEQGGTEEALDLVDSLLENPHSGFLQQVLEILLLKVRDACIFPLAVKSRTAEGFSLKRAERYVEEISRIRSHLESNGAPSLLLFSGICRLQQG